jgi:hypothetical protein
VRVAWVVAWILWLLGVICAAIASRLVPTQPVTAGRLHAIATALISAGLASVATVRAFPDLA